MKLTCAQPKITVVSTPVKGFEIPEITITLVSTFGGDPEKNGYPRMTKKENQWLIGTGGRRAITTYLEKDKYFWPQFYGSADIYAIMRDGEKLLAQRRLWAELFQVMPRPFLEKNTNWTAAMGSE